MTHTFKTFDKVLYRISPMATWSPGFYSCGRDDGHHFVIGVGVRLNPRDVIPYDEYDYLIGTTMEPMHAPEKEDCPFSFGDHIEWFAGSGRWWRPGLFIKVTDQKGGNGCTLCRIVDDHGIKFDIRPDFIRLPKKDEKQQDNPESDHQFKFGDKVTARSKERPSVITNGVFSRKDDLSLWLVVPDCEEICRFYLHNWDFKAGWEDIEPKYQALDNIEFCHGDSWEGGTYAGFDPESGTHAVTDQSGRTIHGIRDTHLRHRVS